MTYDFRFRPPQPPTPAPGEFTVQRSVVRDGLAIGVRARGRRRVPAAPAARLPRDQAHLVAQHRPAGGGRLRGHRPRPAWLRRQRPLLRRRLRPRGVLAATSTRSCTTSSATTGARVVGRRHRRCRRRRPRPPLRRLRAAVLLLQHGAAGRIDHYAAAGMDYGSFERARATGPPATTASCQGARPDELAAMLPTDAARRQWIAGMYRAGCGRRRAPSDAPRSTS